MAWWTWIVLLVVVLAGAVASVMLGMRARAPWALDTMRWVTRIFFNRRQMRTAGTPGAYASIIRHPGRVSGKAYVTPVGATPTGDGFVIALPYDTRSDWVKNVLAAGSATLTHEGQTNELDRPEVLPIEWGEPYFTEKDRSSHRSVNVANCLRLRAVVSV